jgi:hypothetical protein
MAPAMFCITVVAAMTAPARLLICGTWSGRNAPHGAGLRHSDGRHGVSRILKCAEGRSKERQLVLSQGQRGDRRAQVELRSLY